MTTMKRISGIACMAGMILLLVAGGVLAQTPAKENPLLGAEEATPANWNKPGLVWKSGTIDRIGEEMVVIGDVGYVLVDATRFYTEDGTQLTRLNFYKGTRVTFVLAEDRQTILSLMKTR